MPSLGLPHSKQVKKIEKVKDGSIENQPKVIKDQNFIGKKSGIYFLTCDNVMASLTH